MKNKKIKHRLLKKVLKKVAQPPGTLVHIGEKKTETTELDLIHYEKEVLKEKQSLDLSECLLEKDKKGVCWINLSGIHEISFVENICNNFNIHPLVQEDILNTLHRPKFEDYQDYLFVVLKMLRYDKEIKEIITEQVSLILGPNYLLTFQEIKGDVFEPVRVRLRNPRGRFRNMGPDYLFYTLVDAIVDNYFYVLEAIGEDIEELENSMLIEPTPQTLQSIHKLKRELIFLRKAVWPLREVLNALIKNDIRLIKKKTEIFLRDVYDHTIHVIDTVETYRDMVSGLQDLYLSSMSNRMNEVMKVLTIMATIFIPLTFIAGIYGMNFEFMPELKWRMGYFVIWGIMAVLAIGMVLFFKRKKWL